MAEGVTYADLRFAKSPAEKGRTPGEAPPEERSDGGGELTYENFPAAPRPRQPAGPDPQPPGAVRGRVRSLVPLALLGACLFLLATCLGLGLRYWQVSQQMEEVSRRHSMESGALAQWLGSQEENLTQTLQLLSQAQAELNTTRLALQQSQEAKNCTRWHLEATKRVLDHLASCQQTDCCPWGWKHFSHKCLWISSEWKTWGESKQECENNEAQLLILDPWDAGTTWDTAAIRSLLRSDEFWIGLTRKPEWNWEWRWVDGTRYTGMKNLRTYGVCAKVSQGILKEEYCNYQRRYICEKAVTLFSWSVDPSA